MILLDSSNNLVAVLSAAIATTNPDFSADAVQYSSSFAVDGLSPNSGALNGTTPVTLVAAPTAGKFRQVRTMQIANRDTAAVQVEVRKSTGARRLCRIDLPVGYVLQYSDELGFNVIDTAGRTLQRQAFAGASSVLVPPGYANASLTATKTITSGTSFAVYVGKAPAALTSAVVRSRVTTAMATITWGEVALAKGSINVGGNPTLTVVGFADVSASFNSTGQKSTTVNISSGQQIIEGDDLWVIIGNQATTAAVMRAQSIADDIQTGIQASVGSRPSTIVGTPTAFTIEGATTLAAWVNLIV